MSDVDIRQIIREEVTAAVEAALAGEERRYSPQALADLWSISARHVRSWIARGCPALAAGATWRLSPREVRQWLETRPRGQRGGHLRNK